MFLKEYGFWQKNSSWKGYSLFQTVPGKDMGVVDENEILKQILSAETLLWQGDGSESSSDIGIVFLEHYSSTTL